VLIFFKVTISYVLGQSDVSLGTHMTRLTAKALMYLVLTSSNATASYNAAMHAQNSSNASSSSASTPTSSSMASVTSINLLRQTPAKSALRRAAIGMY
jgi:hypothetical protein